jgi:hypothetical protein
MLNFFIVAWILPALLVEVSLRLWLWRRPSSHGQGYVLVSALLRMLCYSPCLVGAMLIAVPVPLLTVTVTWIWTRVTGSPSESMVYLFHGVPELVVFSVAWMISEWNRRVFMRARAG